MKIYGQLTDEQGRCVHYHSALDIIASRCGICGKFYACYQCHDQAENHSFGAVSPDEPETVMCGVCHRLFSYNEYKKVCQCPECRSPFNPRCSLHKEIYSKSR